MIRHINKILLLGLISIFIGCKEKETSPINDKNTKETITENVKLEDNSNYSIWYFSAQNIDKSYENVTIYISNDSIKVMDGNLLKCKGEIVQEKSTFTDYFKSQKNGAEIKKKLKSDYGLNISDDITVVMNANGDISQEGCLFPFNDIFIIDNHLFYYDKGYHCFVQNKEKQSVTEVKVNSWIGSYETKINKNSDDTNAMHIVSLGIKKDSVLFEIYGYHVSQKYLLKAIKAGNKLKLEFIKDLTELDDPQIEKVKDFAVITYEGNKYMLSSHYIDVNFGYGEKQICILKKTID